MLQAHDLLQVLDLHIPADLCRACVTHVEQLPPDHTGRGGTALSAVGWGQHCYLLDYVRSFVFEFVRLPWSEICSARVIRLLLLYLDYVYTITI